MQQSISITSIASVSPLGKTLDDTWTNYKNGEHYITQKRDRNFNVLVAELPESIKKDIESLRISDNKYKALDNSVLYAIYAARQAFKNANWKAANNFGINIGSSRGATQLFETYHKDFLLNNKVKALSSPTTTLGNISSWVAHDLQTKGPEISHSITCSTGLHALLNGSIWINSGACSKFLVGASEAALTPFTIVQMQALKIYAKTNTEFPCRALDLFKTENTMVLSEAASMACLEQGKKENALAIIRGIGYATEVLQHNVSLSTEADCFQQSMVMALGNLNPNDVDIIVTHTPGTIKGDLAEYNAIKEIFCSKIPALTTNKWKVGHSLATSGMLSIEMAVLMLMHQEFISVPFIDKKQPKRIKYILVNAVGFGGNAVSVLLTK